MVDEKGFNFYVEHRNPYLLPFKGGPAQSFLFYKLPLFN